MKGYRFITDDDTSEFCHRVTEALSSGWKLYGEPKMTFDKKRGVMRCGQAVIKNAPRKNYSKKILNNLIYIYKSKGTHNSVNALLNTYGYPSEAIEIREIGGQSEHMNPIVINSEVNDKRLEYNQLEKEYQKGNITKEELLEQLKQNTISCKNVSFRVFGFSLAAINTIFSLILSVIFIKLFFNYGKNQ